jgi:hypothetical protein
MFPDPLPSSRRPIVARVGSHGNVFTESLPSSGSMRHNTYMHTLQNSIYPYLYGYTAYVCAIFRNHKQCDVLRTSGKCVRMFACPVSQDPLGSTK